MSTILHFIGCPQACKFFLVNRIWSPTLLRRVLDSRRATGRGAPAPSHGHPFCRLYERLPSPTITCLGHRHDALRARDDLVPTQEEEQRLYDRHKAAIRRRYDHSSWGGCSPYQGPSCCQWGPYHHLDLCVVMAEERATREAFRDGVREAQEKHAIFGVWQDDLQRCLLEARERYLAAKRGATPDDATHIALGCPTCPSWTNALQTSTRRVDSADVRAIVNGEAAEGRTVESEGLDASNVRLRLTAFWPPSAAAAAAVDTGEVCVWSYTQGRKVACWPSGRAHMAEESD